MNIFLNESFLTGFYFYFLLIIFLAVIILYIIRAKFINNLFKSIPNKFYVFLVLIFIFALVWRVFIMPPHMQIYHDEYVFLNVAENFALDQSFSMCASRIGSDICLFNSFSAWPPAVPFLYSFLFRTFGLSNSIIFLFNALMGSLSVVVGFFLAFALFKKLNLSILFALMLATLPFHIRLSGSYALSIISLLLSMLGFLLIIHYTKTLNLYDAFLFVLFFAFLINIRIENILLILPYGLYFLLNTKKILPVRHVRFSFLLLLLSIPFFQYLFRGITLETESWTLSLSEHIHFLLIQFVGNLQFLFAHSSIHIVISLGLIVGVILSFKDYKKSLPLILWFATLFLFLTSYPAGRFAAVNNFRYVLILSPVIFLFSAFFYDWLIEKIKTSSIYSKTTSNLISVFFLLLLCLVLFLIPVQNFESITKTNELMNLFDEAETFSSSIPDDCLVLSNDPLFASFIINHDIISLSNYDYNLFKSDYNCAKILYFHMSDSLQLSRSQTPFVGEQERMISWEIADKTSISILSVI